MNHPRQPQWNDGDIVEDESVHQASTIRRRRRRRRRQREESSNLPPTLPCPASPRRVTNPITTSTITTMMILVLIIMTTATPTTHAWVMVSPYSTTTMIPSPMHRPVSSRQEQRHGWSRRSSSSSLHVQGRPTVSGDDEQYDPNDPISTTTTAPVSRAPPSQKKASRFAQAQFQRPPRPSSLESPRRRSTTGTTTTGTTTTPVPFTATTIHNSTPPPPLLGRNHPNGSRPRTTTTAPSPPMDRDRMWKRPTHSNNNNSNTNNNMNSIDALEQRLMQRYGTDLSPWTSGEFDDDDDDDDDDIEDHHSTSTTQSPTVFDPWQDDTDGTLDTLPLMDRHRRTTTTTESGNPPVPSISSSIQQKSPLAAFGGRRNDVAPPPQSTTTATTTTNKAPFDLSHLIAPKPVGGRGTLGAPNQRVVSSMERPVIAATTTQPIWDAQGVPMLLTVKQAQRLFEEQLPPPPSTESVVSSSSNETDHHHNMEAEDVVPPTTGTTAITATWEELGITNPKLLHNLKRINCEYPLPAQRTSGPNIVSGATDVIIGTYTGSGKTLAFLVPIIQRILQQQEDDPTVYDQKSGYVKLIIVAPGRELASQIATVTRTLIADDVGLSCLLAIGGTTFTRNLEHIRKRKPDILIGTPGRLAELIIGTTSSSSSDTNHNMKRGGRVAINNVQAIVLDEFDALLSYPPHSEPVRALMDVMKRHRGNDLQTIMCSATASDMMNQPKGPWRDEQYLRPGHVVAMADANDILVTALPPSEDRRGTDATTMTTRPVTTRTTRVSRTVMHGVVHVPHKRFALDTLRRILHTEPIPQQILIFVSDSRKVGIVVEKLANVGIIAAPLHGGMDSEKMDRAEVSRALREGYVGIVVSTEMAARGLDAPLLTHVINMDLPTDPSHYAHRAGRCGRGGRPGVVINLTTSPQERGVPFKFADQLGVTMYTVQVKNAKLNVIDPKSQIVDGS